MNVCMRLCLIYTDKLKALYHNTSWNNAYKDIEKVLVKKVLKGNRNQYILEIKIR